MTFKEKLKQEHPEQIDENYEGGAFECPAYYGYEEPQNYCPEGMNCYECWNREMPEEETK